MDGCVAAAGDAPDSDHGDDGDVLLLLMMFNPMVFSRSLHLQLWAILMLPLCCLKLEYRCKLAPCCYRLHAHRLVK